MLDSFAVGNTIGEHLSIKDRIVVDEIPSGRYHLTTIMEAMRENRVVSVTYLSSSAIRADTHSRWSLIA